MIDMTQKRVTIRALAIELDGGGWVAQCLDYDVVAQAKTFSDLGVELERILVSHVAVSLELGREPFAGFKPAPRKFWDLFERVHARVEFDDGRFAIPGSRTAPAIMPKIKFATERELARVN